MNPKGEIPGRVRLSCDRLTPAPKNNFFKIFFGQLLYDGVLASFLQLTVISIACFLLHLMLCLNKFFFWLTYRYVYYQYQPTILYCTVFLGSDDNNKILFNNLYVVASDIRSSTHVTFYQIIM